MITREWLKAFLPIGALESDGTVNILGAGFLLAEVGGLYLVTASHVVADASGRPIVTILTRVGGGTTLLNLSEIQQEYHLRWHSHKTMDTALALMPTSPEWDVIAISKDHLLPVSEIVPSMDAYTVGCPYGVTGFDPQRNTPLVLDGVISGVDASRKLIYTNAPTFPGNSGGPLLVHRSPFNPSGGLTVGKPILFVAGIVSKMHIVGHPALPEIPGLHLGEACSTDSILELLHYKVVQKERAKITTTSV